MDIDIDLPPDVEIDKLFPMVRHASRVEDGELKKHQVGVHFQEIPLDSITGLAAIPFTDVEDEGYYKIDMLHLNLLQHFDSKDEMRKLQDEEPDWSLLENEDVVKRLFHLGKHFDTIAKVKPKSVEQLADVFALIRPNKRVLLDKYLQNPERWREELFTKRDPSDMRKAHAVPYALMIVLQLHLIKQGRL